MCQSEPNSLPIPHQATNLLPDYTIENRDGWKFSISNGTESRIFDCFELNNSGYRCGNGNPAQKKYWLEDNPNGHSDYEFIEFAKENWTEGVIEVE